MDGNGSMENCPHCGADLRGAVGVEETRGEPSGARPGGKTVAAELVACPECGRVIDGFTPH